VRAQQWFAGFRHGAQVARDGGYRQQATVESSFRTAAHEAWNMPTVGAPRTPIEELGPPGESLPPPTPGPTPMPTLPDQSTNGSASPASPPAEVDSSAAPDADGAAKEFRRALDAAAAATQPAASPPADAADATASPLELPTADDADPQSPADIESP